MARVRYVVRQETSRTTGTTWLVFRMNRINQAWGVAVYTNQLAAERVCQMLNELTFFEQFSEQDTDDE